MIVSTIAALLAALAAFNGRPGGTITVALANVQPFRSGGGYAPPCSVNPVDGGCASASLYALSNSGAQLSASYFYGNSPFASVPNSSVPTLFAFDSAQTGQIGTGATLSSSDTLLRNASLHYTTRGLTNVPYVDPWYLIGPSPDSTLIALDQSPYTDGAGNYWADAGHICQLKTGVAANPGNGILGGNQLACTPPGSGTYDVYIQGIDLTRLAATATQTDTVQVVLAGGGGSSTSRLHFWNVKIGAFSAAAAASTSGLALIYAGGSSSGQTFASVELANVLCDGNFRGHTGSTSVWKCFDDNRSGGRSYPPLNNTYPLYVINTLVRDLGHDPFTGGNANDFSFINSFADGIALAGAPGGIGPHGEIAELGTSGNIPSGITVNGHAVPPRNLTYKNWGLYERATTQTVQFTSPIYTTGQLNGAISNIDVENYLVVTNGAHCSNVQTSYSAAQPCNPSNSDSHSGSAILALGYDVNVPQFTLLDGRIDPSGSFYCFTNGGQNGVGSVTDVSGTTLNIKVASLQDTGASQTATWAGSMIGSSAEATNGFIPTKITGYGTFNNFASFSAQIGAAAGLGAGVMQAATPMYLAGGQPVNPIAGSSWGYIADGQVGPLTTWNVVTAPHGSTPSSQSSAGDTLLSVNPNSDAVAGVNPGVGTLTLAATEPTLTNVQGLNVWAAVDSITDQVGGQYTNFTFSAALGSAQHAADITARTGASTGHMSCR